MAKRATMLKTQLGLAVVIVSVNIGTTVWAYTSYPPDPHGVGTFTSFGNCSTLSMINSSVHVALNIISSLFLGAGNYCMQILIAPSRAEMDKAHSKGVSLSIGVSNVGNSRYIERKRVFSWLLIGMFATILHLL